ncbi:hypothetical protein KY345_00530 [Candidatus Woesearchaeota archaeon]|nr:hypothetical protein [Candidatus Woesearchaeota archaeon]
MDADIRLEGILRKVSRAALVKKTDSEGLVMPDEYHKTELVIEGYRGGTSNLEVFGVVPRKYKGKGVRFEQTFEQFGRWKFYTQMFYVEGNNIINQRVVRHSTESG